MMVTDNRDGTFTITLSADQLWAVWRSLSSMHGQDEKRRNGLVKRFGDEADTTGVDEMLRLRWSVMEAIRPWRNRIKRSMGLAARRA